MRRTEMLQEIRKIRFEEVSKTQLTQFGRAMKLLGIQMIPAYSPEALSTRENRGSLFEKGCEGFLKVFCGHKQLLNLICIQQ